MPNNFVLVKFEQATAVASAGVVTTDSQNVERYARVEAVWVKFTSASDDPEIKVEWEGGVSSSDFEGTAANDDLVSDSNADFAADKQGWHALSMPPVRAPFLRFVITGVGTNPADTLASLYAYMREDFA